MMALELSVCYPSRVLSAGKVSNSTAMWNSRSLQAKNKVSLAQEPTLVRATSFVRAERLSYPFSFTNFIGELRAADANLTLMIQADMTAYRAPGEPLQLGLPDR